MMEKSWKFYESENSEHLDDHLYILFQHSNVTALEVLQGDDVKYISKETFLKNLLLYNLASCEQKLLVHVVELSKQNLNAIK